MGVRINSKVDLTGCPACSADLHKLIITLDNTLDQAGNLTPPGLNLVDLFKTLLIAPVQKPGYNFDLRLRCQATCEVSKPSTDWVISNWNCPNTNQGANMATPISAILTNENVGALPPVHPGEILKDWIDEGGPDRRASVVGYAGVPEDQLDKIINQEASLDRETALKLRTVLGPTAEVLFRMQYDFDEFRKTGHRPAKSGFPSLLAG